MLYRIKVVRNNCQMQVCPGCSVDTWGQRAGVKKVEGSGLHCGRIPGTQTVRRQDGRSGRPQLFR